jgi:hypothetical protein
MKCESKSFSACASPKEPLGQDIFLSAIFLSAGIRQENGRQENGGQENGGQENGGQENVQTPTAFNNRKFHRKQLP